MSGQVTTKPPILQSLALHLARPVADDTVARARRHLLDWLGVAAAGAGTVPARGFAAVAGSGGSGACATLGLGRRDWWHALQCNAALGNLLEMDDLHRSSILHPGPVIIPAALAIAETTGGGARATLEAIVRGYESTIRIGRALGPRHYAFFHNTSSAGAFGAAAAAAHLLRLNPLQTAWALANAGSRSGGLWQMRHEECETKSLHNVQAAQTGVQAALLAQHGVRGPLSLLEGAQGLFAATAPGADPWQVMRDADAPWLMHEVSFKPWPACRHAHPAIDAALALRASVAAGTMESVVRIELETYRSAIDFCDRPTPRTESQAKFSLQHCVAASLLEGAPWLAQYAPASFNDSRIAALRARVVVREAAALTARFPAHYGALLVLHLADGRLLRHEQPDALGDPELPLSDAALMQKATRLLAVAGWNNGDAVAAATLALADDPPLTAWTALWQPGGGVA